MGFNSAFKGLNRFRKCICSNIMPPGFKWALGEEQHSPRWKYSNKSC